MFPSASDLQKCDGDVPSRARLDFAPEPVLAGQAQARSRREILVAWGFGAGVTAALGVAVSALWLLRPPALAQETEIPVEIVSQMPGGSGSNATGMPGQGPAGADGPDVAVSASVSAPASPPTSSSTPPASSPTVASAVDVPPAPAAGAPPAPLPAPRPAPSQAAAPKRNDPPLVAPPPEPAMSKPDAPRGKPADAAATPVATEQPRTEPAPPPQAPSILATPDRTAAVATPAPPPPSEKPPAPASKAADKATQNAERFAAAFPTNLESLPSTFQAALSGNGAQANAEYKGLVFGRLGRSGNARAQAQARHLRGGVILSFSIDDAGRIVSLGVLRSSGHPDVDAVALDMVREAAPFPPPPPGAQRDFTPALMIGQ